MQISKFLFTAIALALLCASCSHKSVRIVEDFTENWLFTLADSVGDFSSMKTDDSAWRTLNLPHDWSIESDFSDKNPATPGGGALPGGIGWYRKVFNVDQARNGKKIYIDFDGVYRNSEVWINGTSVGKRPNGYISFRYDLTPYIKFGEKNVVAVKVDNSQQPNSRWYSGSGIYRNVRLVTAHPIHIDLWGTYVTTPKIDEQTATVRIVTRIKNTTRKEPSFGVKTVIVDQQGRTVGKCKTVSNMALKGINSVDQEISISQPILWSIENPYLYTVRTTLVVDGKTVDAYETPMGIRTFAFDPEKGFSLNGKPVKINGVCNHHDLGCLGAAVNTRAIGRQLEILKAMGCNGIRCSHNPPAPELLDLCDKMGFIVMDEAFDMWLKKKSPYDYSQYFAEWHERDLTDLILRDRNHPSVFMWSIGNEVPEQWAGNTEEELSNALLTNRLAEIVRTIDPTRPIVAGCDETRPGNPLFKSGALDIIGFNYHLSDYKDVPENFPGKPFIASESVSGLMSRGYYQMPSDSINIWPEHWSKPFYHSVHQCSSYDNCHVPWGNSHEASWKSIKKMDYVSGQYIWTGFDYLGEPTPFWWPSRSSYFGIIDLAGFPKDIYYMYQSEWTDQAVLHVFPHWNWNPGEIVDIWVYYNQADEVELFLNGKSLGIKKKEGDDLHVCWRLPFETGALKAISRKSGEEIGSKEIKTAGIPVQIRLTADREKISANGKDLAFITVEAVDETGYPVPTANQLIQFSIEGEGSIVGTDNGDATNPHSLKKPERELFNGKALVVVQAGKKPGIVKLKASAAGLEGKEIGIKAM